MNTRTYKVDSARGHFLKLVSGLIGGVGMIPCICAAMGLKGDRNALVSWGNDWWPVGLAIMLIAIAFSLYASYGYYSVLTITEQPNLGLHLHIADPGSQEKSANGKWKWFAYYTVHPQKYGMEKKECHVVLFNKDKAFCELRQDLGTLTQKPVPEFIELPAEIIPGTWTYRTRNINEILTVVMNSSGAEQIRPDLKNKRSAEPDVPVQPRPVPKKANVDQSQPEYGDPDYDL